MRTKEFIKRVEELGYKTFKRDYHIAIYSGCDKLEAIVSSERYCGLNCCYEGMTTRTLFDIIVEYAKTPIEDREEEKKFYAKHRYLVQAGDYTTAFLNYATNNDRLYVYTKAQTYSVKTQFTLKEIEEIKKKFDTDLKDFELVEVVDEV